MARRWNERVLYVADLVSECVVISFHEDEDDADEEA
jgi:hypothetical protein